MRNSISDIGRRAVVFFFHLLVLTVPFIFTWVNEELFEFNKMILTYGLTTLILGCWTIRMIAEKKLLWRATPSDLPLVAFFISQLLSTLLSIHPRTSVLGYYTRFHGGLLSTITYILLYYAFVSNFTKKDLRFFLSSIFMAGIGVSLYAIPEHFGRSPSCFLINNGESFDVSCWVQDVKTRVFATFGQPNWLAAYAITLIPVGVALTLIPSSISGRSQSKENAKRSVLLPSVLEKAVYTLAVVLLFTTLLFTKSRSGVLGLGLGLGVFILGYLVLVWKNHIKLTFLAGWLAVLGVVAGIFGTPFTPSLGELTQVAAAPPAPVATNSSSLTATTSTSPQSSSPPSPPPAPADRLEAGGTDSGEIRKIVWEGAIKVWQRYPIFGSGVETFAYSYYQDRPTAHNVVSEWDFLYNKAHNEFLNFLATTGVVGLFTYCLVLAAIGGACALVILEPKIYRSISDRLPNLALVGASPSTFSWPKKAETECSPDIALLALGLLSGLVALSVSNFFGFSTVMVSILLFLFPALIVVMTRQPLAPTPHHRESDLSSGQWAGLGFTLLTTLFALNQISNWWWADHYFALSKQYLRAGMGSETETLLQSAIEHSPQEALFYDELASLYATVAVNTGLEGQVAQAEQLAQAAIINSNKALDLNPRHLNFYRSRARIFIALSALSSLKTDLFNAELKTEAITTLKEALKLSPTDAKLIYNLALVEYSNGQTADALTHLEQAVALKPNYDSARAELGRVYETRGEWEKARDQYHYILTNITPNNPTIQERLSAVEASISAQKK